MLLHPSISPNRRDGSRVGWFGGDADDGWPAEHLLAVHCHRHLAFCHCSRSVSNSAYSNIIHWFYGFIWDLPVIWYNTYNYRKSSQATSPFHFIDNFHFLNNCLFSLRNNFFLSSTSLWILLSTSLSNINSITN